MKKIAFHLVVIQMVFMVLIITSCDSENHFSEIESSLDLPEIPIDSLPQQEVRNAITFILGKDKNDKNRYYEEAINYYAFNEKGKTEHLITNIRSLKGVLEFLRKYKPANGKPWESINLVSHGNQWMGLSVKVTDHSKRATPERIREYIDNQSLLPLSPDVINENSVIFVHGCGLGNNQNLLQAIAEAFGGKNGQVTVRASRLFEYYTSEKDRSRVVSSESYMAQSYSLSYKMGYQPEDNVLIKKFKQTHADAGIDWQDALKRTTPRFPGDTYHFTFEVPVKWVIPFENNDSLPDLSTKEKQLTWIKTQPHIIEKLEAIDLPIEKFNWWFRQVYVKDANNEKKPAVWLKGYATILSVLKALVVENTETGETSPFKPDFDNKVYYLQTGADSFKTGFEQKR